MTVKRDKTCIKCGLLKPLDDFGRDASRKDGRYTYCKQCRRNPNRQELIIEELAKKGMKSCSLCHKVKPFNAFESDSSKKLGVTSRCKKCKREQRRAKAQKWHQDKKNQEDLYTAGKSKCYKCCQIKPFSSFLKTKKNPRGTFNLCLDCNNQIRREYNRLRSKAGRDYTRWDVFEEDNFTCYICEDVLNPDVFSPDPKSLTIDHVVPICRGGTDERVNVRTACLDCNRKKNDLMLEDYLAKIKVA